MFCQCLAVDRIEESEERVFYEEIAGEEDKELGFTNEARENDDEEWDGNEQYGCYSKANVPFSFVRM
jgi:hypothetical protein